MGQNPLISITDRTGIFPVQLCGSVAYYAAMSKFATALVDTSLVYDKRFKSTHRYEIVDTRDRLMLTVPIKKPSTSSHEGHRIKWADMKVSDHGQWWTDHRISLESAYGRTPYFEFYIDRFLPLLSINSAGMSIVDFDIKFDKIIREILGLGTTVIYDSQSLQSPGIDFGANPPVAVPQYYQIREDKLGFVPGLSILDLIFNMGSEAPLILEKAKLP